MKFDSEHKVEIDTLNETEAREFLTFLGDEIARHKEAIRIDVLMIIGSKYQKKLALGQFYKSAITRHKMDIDNAVKLCHDVCIRFKIADTLEE